LLLKSLLSVWWEEGLWWLDERNVYCKSSSSETFQQGRFSS
jgi:hypothetical protein